ncbi:hypothetical protein BV98_000770 [Sphingobium herbicidovorans NBRC 16415]|uniref:Uncharacterized protein n=1 Tax=Sphingobium herbicidovorans (strain ATCC 700291 / DSM 11019 / CCUG 56400 / KCTC 2939 / LMG 18315 / NBRC 16415 / MH) TaxID=1219045 RepID=A0A086PDV5_SPHHM|nr:hypothetical protein BV98_000770 [Sphingobium herbicidovorans NBRC 16415]
MCYHEFAEQPIAFGTAIADIAAALGMTVALLNDLTVERRWQPLQNLRQQMRVIGKVGQAEIESALVGRDFYTRDDLRLFPAALVLTIRYRGLDDDCRILANGFQRREKPQSSFKRGAKECVHR